MRLVGSSKFARVSGLGSLLGDTLAQADLLMSQGNAAYNDQQFAQAYTAFKQASAYYTQEEAAATQRAQASKLASDWEAAHRITAKVEAANDGMNRAANQIALVSNAYAALPKPTEINTPESLIARTPYIKLLDLLNRPFPAALAPAPPDELYFSDRLTYLRQALNTRNWDAVARWYALDYTAVLAKSQKASGLWADSQINLQDYCTRTFDLDDLAAFLRKCLVKYCVFDLGVYPGIGYAGDADYKVPAFISRCSLNQPNFVSGDEGIQRFLNFLTNSKFVGPMRFPGVYDACVRAQRYSFSVNWMQEANKWNTGVLGFTAIIAGLAVLTGYGVGAFLAPAAGAGGGVVGAEAGGASAVGGAAVSTSAGVSSGALAAGGIDTIVVTGTAIGSGAGAAGIVGATVGAGLATGAIVSSGAPAAISSPTIPADGGLETVTVTGTALPAGSAAGTVGAGLGAGAIVATATPPALTADAPIEITVEGTRPTLPELNNLPIAGGITGGLTPLNVDALQPGEVQIDDGSSLSATIKDNLLNAIKSFGMQYVRDHLAELLHDQLGRNPTTDELGTWGDWLDSNPQESWYNNKALLLGLLGLAITAAIVMSKKGRKKGATRVRRKKR